MQTIQEYQDELQSNKKVFLGGTCGNSTWRQYVMPKLTINYFDPVVKDWNDEAYKKNLKKEKIAIIVYIQ